MKRRVFSLSLTIALLLGACVHVSALDRCDYWQSRVDPTVDRPTGFDAFDEQDPNNLMSGIDCLLQLKGRKGKAAFGGATRYDVSQIDPVPPVEVAALFYVSFLFNREWGSFAETVTLVDRDGKANSPEAISTAYASYRRWFATVNEIGLDRARELKLDPLAGSGVHWR